MSADERATLVGGDFVGFWHKRIHKDPVARLALAMWSKEKLCDAIDDANESEFQSWQPKPNLLGRAVMAFLPNAISKVPKNKAEQKEFWYAMGQRAIGDLSKALDKYHVAGDSLALRRSVAHALAMAHMKTLDDDALSSKGTAALLSASQVSDYHHEVFASFGLPPEVYGGTPYRYVPDFIELFVGAGLYLPSRDRD